MHETLYRRALKDLEPARSKVRGKYPFLLRKRQAILGLLEGLCVVVGDTFSALAPVFGLQQKMATSRSPSSAVHDGEYNTKYIISQQLLHAAFVYDEVGGDMLEPEELVPNLRTRLIRSRQGYRFFRGIVVRSVQGGGVDETH